MNTLWIVVIARARHLSRPTTSTPAGSTETSSSRTPRGQLRRRMYMDGVDFMPTSKNVLYGYHFKSIAAAGPIVGPITAANIWGWAALARSGWSSASASSAGRATTRPSWSRCGTTATACRAISHRLIAPRTRTILFVFIFFYLMLLAGAFVGILAAILSARPDVPFGIIMLALMGLLAGPDDVPLEDGHHPRHGPSSSPITLVGNGARTVGPAQGRQGRARPGTGRRRGRGVERRRRQPQRPSSRCCASTTRRTADPRIPAPGPDGKRPDDGRVRRRHGPACKTLPNYLLWMVFLFVFSLLRGEPADLAVRAAGELHRLLDHAHHDRARARSGWSSRR